MVKKEEMQFQNRMDCHIEELRWLYMELYHNESIETVNGFQAWQIYIKECPHS